MVQGLMPCDVVGDGQTKQEMQNVGNGDIWPLVIFIPYYKYYTSITAKIQIIKRGIRALFLFGDREVACYCPSDGANLVRQQSSGESSNCPVSEGRVRAPCPRERRSERAGAHGSDGALG